MISIKNRNKLTCFLFFALGLILCFNSVFIRPTELTTQASTDEKRYNVTETNIYLTNNKRTDYVIAIPSDATENEIYAANELRTFLNAASDADFKIKSERDLSATQRYISVGESGLFESANIPVNEDFLGASGYIIKTLNGNVYIVGAGNDYGTIFGVYGFLNYQINYRYYSYDCIEYDNISTVKLKNFDVIDVPDFEGRWIGESSVWRYEDRMLRYRQFEPFLDDVSPLWHTAQFYVSADEYLAEHPEWFVGTDGWCFSQDGLVDEVCKIFQQRLLDFSEVKGKTVFMFGQSDVMTQCSCNKCKDAINKYVNITAVYIKFFNKLAEKMQVWIDANQPGREVYYGFLAYKFSQNAPDYSQEMVMNEHVAVVFAPIYNNYYVPFTDPVNENTKRSLEGWAKLTDNIYYYGYGVYNPNNAMYYPYNFNSIQADYQYMKEIGVDFVFELGHYWITCWQTFMAMRCYINAELMWDVNADVETLRNEFFKAYYKEGAQFMLQFFNEYRRHFEVLYAEDSQGDLKGYAFRSNKAKFWPMDLLERWIDLTDKAAEQIERYRYIDIELYEKLSDRILQEKTCLEFEMIDLYAANYYSASELYAAKVRVIKNMSKFEMARKEVAYSSQDISALKTEWGL